MTDIRKLNEAWDYNGFLFHSERQAKEAKLKDRIKIYWNTYWGSAPGLIERKEGARGAFYKFAELEPEAMERILTEFESAKKSW